jgi:hypothetical protein
MLRWKKYLRSRTNKLIYWRMIMRGMKLSLILFSLKITQTNMTVLWQNNRSKPMQMVSILLKYQTTLKMSLLRLDFSALSSSMILIISVWTNLTWKSVPLKVKYTFRNCNQKFWSCKNGGWTSKIVWKISSNKLMTTLRRATKNLIATEKLFLKRLKRRKNTY